MVSNLHQLLDQATSEQREIIELNSASAAVISCPGSGKTFTTSLRMAYRLNDWNSLYSGIALLSHTNVAIKSFEHQFRQLGYSQLPRLPHFVGTLDSFITRFLLSNFGYLAMGCLSLPSLITGSENFLNNKNFNVLFNMKKGLYPINIAKLAIGVSSEGKAYIFNDFFGNAILPKFPNDAINALEALGRKGLYTYEHARYWGYKVLEQNPRLCEILAHRFPEIIIDEAQDTNPWQQLILCKLKEAGTKLMLVGDPDQSIFEFGQGDAKYLINHSKQDSVENKKLSESLRSNKKIVSVARWFSTNGSISSQKECDQYWQGAYIIDYTPNSERQLIEFFEEKIASYGLPLNECAAIARSNDLVKKLIGDEINYKKNNTTHRFVIAALERDYKKDYLKCYEICRTLILDFCNAPQIYKEEYANEHELEFRRKIWEFVRNSQVGLPCSKLKAKSEWHPKLKASLEKLCLDLSSLPDLNCPKYIGRKIPVTGLADTALFSAGALPNSSIHINTVHGVKGETFKAVLYVINSSHLTTLLKKLEDCSLEDELIKISYVAMTRPQHLLWLAVPNTVTLKNKQLLKEAGFEFLSSEK